MPARVPAAALSALITTLCVPVSAPAQVPASQAPAIAPPTTLPGADAIRTETLANGLRVIIWPDRDVPSVALYNYVRAGSRNEVPGITGLAHFFEHMMFNGTKSRPPGTFDREMEARGGSNNASTSDDLTIYTDFFPPSALEIVLDLEADRLANLSFDPKVVESERGVVYSERRLRVDDDNTGALFEQVQATAFVAHPYQNPTIGWPSDIETWRIEDLEAFYKTYYAPNNSTLVIVGDVDPDETLAMIRARFGSIPRQSPPPEVRTKEPQQLGERRVALERRAQTPLLQMAFKAPAASDPRAAAISLLGVILAQGDASRLHRRLVEERQLAVNIGTYWQEGFDPGLFWIFATLPEGGDPQVLERAIDAELATVRTAGVTDAELDRARNLVLTAFWQQLATNSGKARLAGEYEVMYGDYRRLFDMPAEFARVTAADIQAVAKEILIPEVRTVGVLVPPADDTAGAAKE